MIAEFKVHDSIVLLRNNQDKNSGTGFAVHREGNRTWLVTCAHVFDDLGGKEHLLVRYQGKDYPVDNSLSGASQGLDLAVLAVEGLDLTPLTLHSDGRPGEAVDICGAQDMGDGHTIAPLAGELGDQQPWEVNGPRIEIWRLKITGKLRAGFSGSPVLRQGTDQVLAITSHRQAEAQGYAIHIGNLPCFWPGLPADLLRGDIQLAWGLRADLRRLVMETLATWGDHSEGAYRLRRLAQLALPLASTSSLPDAPPPFLARIPRMS